MTSVLRSIAQIPRQQSKFFRLESPCYYDSTLAYATLFPFTLNNNVLDIAYIDSFKADMVDTPATAPNTDPDVSVRLMGGTEIVKGLGDNFKEYITAWRNPDAGTPISIFVNGVVQRVQMTTDNFLGDSSYQISTQPPSSDGYIIGDSSNSYRTTWVFKQPLTITTVESGVTQYITFSTRYDED